MATCSAVWRIVVASWLAYMAAGTHTHAIDAQFGHKLRSLFALADNYTNLNHGSYGSPPKRVLEAAREWELRMESNPDRWFRYDVYGLVDRVRERLAAYLGADPEDIAFVPNASHGVNAVLRSLKVPAKKKILYLSSAYKMVKNTLDFLETFREDQLLEVPVTWPATQDEIVASVSAALEANPGAVHAASFSHIVSVPGAVLPVKALTKLCQRHGALVLIDGAHALGQVPVNLTDIGADFWVGNGHKWLYSPKGSAVLWVRRDRQALVEPTTISWEGQGKTHFQVAFSYTGTSSYSPYLAMADALDFRQSLGGESAIFNYMHELAVRGGAKLAEIFGTEVLNGNDMVGAMVDVRVPTRNATVAQQLPQRLLERYNTWVPVYPLPYSDVADDTKYYVRVSCQVYNEMSDLEMLGTAMIKLIAELSQ